MWCEYCRLFSTAIILIERPPHRKHFSFFVLTRNRSLGRLFTSSLVLTLWLLICSLLGNAKLIEKATYSGIILPSGEWHTLNHHGLIAKITYRIRVLCDKHYYNSTCMKFCRPRDDKFGHFTCDPQGNKECIAGWTGTNCEIGELLQKINHIFCRYLIYLLTFLCEQLLAWL